jgi:hypothetical protein
MNCRAGARMTHRFATREVPARAFPATGMSAQDAFRLVSEDLALEGGRTPHFIPQG